MLGRAFFYADRLPLHSNWETGDQPSQMKCAKLCRIGGSRTSRSSWKVLGRLANMISSHPIRGGLEAERSLLVAVDLGVISKKTSHDGRTFDLKAKVLSKAR